MAAVLAGDRSAAVAVEELMLRPQKTEQESRYDLGYFRSASGEGLSKTTQQIVQRFDELVSQTETPERKGRPIDVDTIEALEELLIMADVGVAATERILDAVKKQTETGKGLRDAVKDEIRAIFAAVPAPASNGHVPHVVLIVGVNGTGKTTTVGKLAQLLEERPASSRWSWPPTRFARPPSSNWRSGPDAQASISSARAKARIPQRVVFDAIASGKANGRDPILVDTAGRLHTKVNLMNELDKIRRIAAREVTGAPHEVLLVLDATVGQNGLEPGA